MVDGATQVISQSCLYRDLIFGLFLLLIVNVSWVASSEVSRHIFVDMKFARPFFVAYVKLSLMAIYCVRFALRRYKYANFEPVNYRKLTGESDGLSDIESLTPAVFEDAFLSEESDFDKTEKPRKVRFSQIREVRHMPLSLADDALRARQPYSSHLCNISSDILSYLRCDLLFQNRYTILLSQMWILCTLTYQGALLWMSVASVNLLSSSSSLFILILNGIFDGEMSSGHRLIKSAMVILNFIGVAIVSDFNVSKTGSMLALISAFLYAVYLVLFNRCQQTAQPLDMDLVFGMVGILTLICYSPLLLLLHRLSFEPLFPLPNSDQFSMIIFGAIIGGIISDYIWLKASLMTSPLAASISLSLSIPLSIAADALFRSQTPSHIQILASVPILISFIGATLLLDNTRKNDGESGNQDEILTLLQEANEIDCGRNSFEDDEL